MPDTFRVNSRLWINKKDRGEDQKMSEVPYRKKLVSLGVSGWWERKVNCKNKWKRNKGHAEGETTPKQPLG